MLIKSIGQAILTYVMSNFQLPMNICHKLESVISNYWWGGDEEQKKMHWISWKTLCLPKAKGGMGFRMFHLFNKALLAKQGWRLIHNTSSLVARVLKGRYYPRSNFLQAKAGYCSSFTWRSILGAKHILTKGCSWRIGNGSSMHIWDDKWLTHPMHQSLLTPKPLDSSIQKVSDLIDLDRREWKRPLIRDTFVPADIPYVFGVPISKRTTADTLFWPHTKDSSYSVHSGYHWLQENQDRDNPSASEVRIRWVKL